jgi:protein-S-isoprenylcysteine O-methyltransferase Ste14
MLALIDPRPVGLPGLFAMLAGFVLFVLALALARRREDAAPKPESETKAGSSWIGVAIQTIGFFLVGFGPLQLLTVTTPALYAEGAVVLALMLFTLGMFVSASRAMGRNWSVVARTRSDHQLVTGGPFAYVRNPIYTGLFALMLAMALAFGHWRGLIPGVPLYWIGTAIRVRDEEKLLRARFGQAYADYAARVKRFVPGVI